MTTILQYERPANQSEAVQNKRASYGQAYYDKFAQSTTKEGVGSLTAIKRLIATAKAEEGYLEKATNAQLDSKTANAGSNNWTKYARDLDKDAREWAIANGLIGGTGNNANGEPNYAWADQLTREQAAALFYRFAKLMGKA